MANTTWKQVVLDTADAYREANGSTEKIPVGSLANKVRAGAGTPYTGDNPLTIGQAGFTFPAKTLLKDGLQIINGVNGEDLTDTVADQTTAVEELMKMVSRKIAMNNGEGQYVWKKSEYIAGGNLALTVLSNKQIQVSSGEVDITNLTNAKLDGVSGTLNSSPVSFTNTTMTINVASINYSYEYSYDSTTGIITLVTSSTTAIGNSGNGTLVITESYIFLDYVVSSDTGAYPDGGTQDGYWYELVEEGIATGLFGCTKYAVDTVAFSATTAPGYSFTHSLGEVPRFAFLIANATWEELRETYAIAESVMLNAPINSNSIYAKQVMSAYRSGSTSGSRMVSRFDRPMSLTVSKTIVQFNSETSITSSGLRLAAVEYTLITMA